MLVNRIIPKEMMVKIIKRRELKLLHPILDTRRKTRGFASEFWIPEGRFWFTSSYSSTVREISGAALV
ncbi:hypothetical protein FQR65_LT07762 [Abscondita terminalis]|nr:hypothetical protein FQR65_LT07762 [Abscondita terminalis]